MLPMTPKVSYQKCVSVVYKMAILVQHIKLKSKQPLSYSRNLAIMNKLYKGSNTRTFVFSVVANCKLLLFDTFLIKHLVTKVVAVFKCDV